MWLDAQLSPVWISLLCAWTLPVCLHVHGHCLFVYMCMDIACLFTCAWTLPVCLHVHEHCLFVYMVIYVCTSDILSKCLLVFCSFPQCVRQASTYGAKRNLIVDGVKILITKVHDLVAVCF